MNGPSLSSKRQEEHEPRAQNDHKKVLRREKNFWAVREVAQESIRAQLYHRGMICVW